ncbi:MAG: SGNH/GDSL hydrolase family protein [Anaerolineae bacterium]|nr:SGNH/GDSL hydrolase family protein [Anaerolineae bacterium]
MKRLRTFAGYLFASLFIELVIIKYVQFLIRKRPKNDPLQYVHEHKTTRDKKVMVCIGDSITRGEVSYDYVELLQQRLGSHFDLVNAGVNSELSHDVLQRLDEVIACDPDVVTLLIGTNDAHGSLDEEGALWLMAHRNLPQKPSAAWFEKNLGTIVRRLRCETRARVAVLSLPTIGEDLTSKLVETTRQFSLVIRRVAGYYGVGYLPLFEQMVGMLNRHDTTRLVEHETWRWQNVKAILAEKILGAELDRIAERNGLLLHTDLLHLNSKGAAMVADQIEGFVRQGEIETTPIDLPDIVKMV